MNEADTNPGEAAADVAGDPARALRPTRIVDAGRLLAGYRRALAERRRWEGLWRDCYRHALPPFDGFGGDTAGRNGYSELYDATAADGVEQLAASLLAYLAPPWSRWFALAPGAALSRDERAALAPLLEKSTALIQDQLERADLSVALHQAFLDLVTAGTACLQVEAAGPGADGALACTAVPLNEVVLAESAGGRLDITYRRQSFDLAGLQQRFPEAVLPAAVGRLGHDEPDRRFPVIEAVLPADRAPQRAVLAEDAVPGAGGPAKTAGVGADGEYVYAAVLDGDELGEAPTLLAQGRFARSPFINFRWVKAPGETYGRSPIMKALPDIKTANKTVELILKNASMAVSGAWQADDDGILNPANIELSPGAVIPKAVGSQGLQPLNPPGRFDVSQVVLEDLRGRIRHALLIDRFAALDGGNGSGMTATEAAQRSAEVTRLLGASYGRLQNELLAPLMQRVVAVLGARGEIPAMALDGRHVALQWRGPLAQAQAQRDAAPALTWLEAIAALGPAAAAHVDAGRLVRWLAEAFGVPEELIARPAAEAAGESGPDGEDQAALDLEALRRGLAELGLAGEAGRGG